MTLLMTLFSSILIAAFHAADKTNKHSSSHGLRALCMLDNLPGALVVLVAVVEVGAATVVVVAVTVLPVQGWYTIMSKRKTLADGNQ